MIARRPLVVGVSRSANAGQRPSCPRFRSFWRPSDLGGGVLSHVIGDSTPAAPDRQRQRRRRQVPGTPKGNGTPGRSEKLYHATRPILRGTPMLPLASGASVFKIHGDEPRVGLLKRNGTPAVRGMFTTPHGRNAVGRLTYPVPRARPFSAFTQFEPAPQLGLRRIKTRARNRNWSCRGRSRCARWPVVFAVAGVKAVAFSLAAFLFAVLWFRTEGGTFP